MSLWQILAPILSGCDIISMNVVMLASRVAKFVTLGEQPVRQRHAEQVAASEGGRDAGFSAFQGSRCGHRGQAWSFRSPPSRTSRPFDRMPRKTT